MRCRFMFGRALGLMHKKRFDADDARLGSRDPRFTLACPNFRNAPKAKALPIQEAVVDGASDTVTITVLDDHDPKTREGNGG